MRCHRPGHSGGFPGRQRGVSLLELLITLAIVGVVLSLGAPSLGDLTRETRLKMVRDRLLTHLMLARNHSVNHASSTVVCPLLNDACGGVDDWSNGWMVFENHNPEDKPVALDPDDVLLAIHRGDPSHVQIGFHRKIAYIRYVNTGLGWPNGTFRLCDTSDEHSGDAIIVRANGRPRLHGVGDDPVECAVES